MGGEIIIGKSPNNYPAGEIDRLVDKIAKGIDVPNSYQATKMRRKMNPDVGNVGVILNEFENSEGKKISLSPPSGGRGELTDNNGKKIYVKDIEWDSDLGYEPPNAKRFRCYDDSAVLTQVADFTLHEPTNEYGEKEELPLMFFVSEIQLATEEPTTQNTYSF